MDGEHLAGIIERIINEVLEQKRQCPKIIRVIVTGNEKETLLNTLNCIKALYQAGYGLAVTLSHSADVSVIKSVCVRWQEEEGIQFSLDELRPEECHEDYYGVFFPALSTNSLTKIALCIRDNIACEWAFHALSRNKPIIATLSKDYETLIENGSIELRKQLIRYIELVENYGVSFQGKRPGNHHVYKRIVTLKDVKLHPSGETLLVERDTLITPAAKDEIERLNLNIKRIN